MKLSRSIRFSLQGLFAVMTIAAIFLGYHVHWIRERHKVLDSVDSEIYTEAFRYSKRAPGLLWMFGEVGRSWVYVSCETDAEWELQRKRTAQLFPEAEIERLPKYYRQFGQQSHK